MGNCFISEEKKEEIKTSTKHPSSLKLHEVVSICKAIHEAGCETGVLRIKMVVSKQELKDMLMKKSGVISVCGDVHHVLDDENRSCMDWKPSLQSIPEAYDDHHF
ncbi:hypothetical protein IHE45_10G089500 [Dioscorea alata]|uniref:Uncharacterized protein n=1 Tax=Dioscorea alata TaxID=55571 RepID=A0ACB7VCU7_DIOAL|nr:hypothetical protein IHE45_10G089500 [Dioscorea alata]